MSKAGAICPDCLTAGEVLRKNWSSKMFGKDHEICNRCNGTGMEPIPWPELFKDERWSILRSNTPTWRAS